MAPAYPSGFTLLDYTLTPIYLTVITFIAINRKNKKIKINPIYKYYVPGLLVKFLGALAMCWIYQYYYKEGGDTLNYYYSAMVMQKLFIQNPLSFLKICILGDLSPQNFSAFNIETGYPLYWSDTLTFSVVRFISPIVMLSFGSYLVSAILLTWIAYSGVWKLYVVFSEQFPEIKDKLALAILFIPSVFFWGSGILKDPITFSGLGWLVFSFHRIIGQKKKRIKYLIFLIISGYVIVSIKPYILYAAIPGLSIWALFSVFNKIKGNFIRYISFPLMLFLFLGGGYFFLDQVGKDKGKYSIDNIFDYAVIVQEDLKREAYQGNSFDIGTFEPTISSMLSKAPLAINAALFRPYLWEARNPVMILSALENFIILAFSLFLLYKLRMIELFRYFNKHPMLVFSFLFALFFSFFVGLSTSNFGSLVRYKIPAIPFYVASLFIINYYYNQIKNNRNIVHVK